MSKQELFEKIFKEHLKVETYSKSIDSLFTPRSKSKIDYAPYYQRNYVWDHHKATYFIESILMGTEIPPLIFFNNNDGVEVIDGRQRFETILRFMENGFTLTGRGLNILNQLKGYSYNTLATKNNDVLESFLDTKIRIIEFRLVNEPPLDVFLQDQVKKEIFARYNSGITPLKKDEIDNAKYDDDDLSNFFKKVYKTDGVKSNLVFKLFFKQPVNGIIEVPIEKIMSFTRRSLVLHMYPINFFVRGTGRTNTLSKLYDFFSDENDENHNAISKEYFTKIEFLNKVQEYSESNHLQVNRLALECFLWGLTILENENILFELNNSLVTKICNHIHENISYYSLIDYNFAPETMARYLETANFFESNFDISFSPYITADDKTKSRLKELTKSDTDLIRLNELESLRLSKPEPANNSIDDIVRTMKRRRYLIRPSYQRKEVINVNKAASIIESILLGIKLPPIFIYKRTDGINEVIDGQQRLLTLLGFIGEDYVNENHESVKSKNFRFKLRSLRILKELNGKSFNELSDEDRDKIYDFQIYVVEIDALQNPDFDPVDLFIRLNDKPYPIRENSFEMWNSWADVEVINQIKELKTSIDSWFYIKKLRRASDRDRMENEELLTSLVYINFYSERSIIPKTIDIYQKTERLNSRINTKSKISTLLLDISDNETEKAKFVESLKSVKSTIKVIKHILIDRDVTKENLSDFLQSELDYVISGGKPDKGFRRRIQDIYFLWILIRNVNFEMARFHRIQMKKEITEIFSFVKNISSRYQDNNKGIMEFQRRAAEFNNKYLTDKRRIRLNEEEVQNLIREQQNSSSISGAPIFLGDDIEVDHIKPISIGGKDDLKNLGIAHKSENRKKGSSF